MPKLTKNDAFQFPRPPHFESLIYSPFWLYAFMVMELTITAREGSKSLSVIFAAVLGICQLFQI